MDLLVKFADEGIGLSSAVSIGNKADIDELDLIEALSDQNMVPTSMIDLTQGVVNEITQLCEASELGAYLYQAALPIADRIELTQIDTDFEGDVLFPEIDPAQWRESRQQPGQASGNGFEYRFVTLNRTTAQ